MSRDLGRAPVASLKTQSSSVLSTSANRSSSRVVQLCRWKTTSNVAAVNVAQNANHRIERRGRKRTWARDKDPTTWGFPQNVFQAPAVRAHLSITMLGIPATCVGTNLSVNQTQNVLDAVFW